MPTITLNKTELEKLIGKKLPLEQLKDRISMLGTDLEKIEGDEIHVEVFPNRPDMLSEQGFARALSSFIGVKTGLRKYNVKKSGHKVIIDKSVTMRPYTACAIVKNLRLTDEKIKELMQIQEKLATTHGRNRKKSAYGVYPLERITFPVRYEARDPKTIRFRPLGFERAISAAEVVELHPKGKEYAHLTAGWTKYPFFVDAAGKILSLLPFTNSHDTGKVDEMTKDVFVECSGIDLENVKVALNILVTMLGDMGGEIYSLEMAYEDKSIKSMVTPDLMAGKMKVDREYINQRLGLELSDAEMKKMLERMGYGYEKGMAFVPVYRADILHQADLMEDVAIAYGYENFKESIPTMVTIGQEDQAEKFYEKLRDGLVGFRLLEVKNYHLMNGVELNEKMMEKGKGIALLNSLGEHNHLRHSLLPSLLKNLSDNKHHEFPQDLFEIGRVFFADAEEETNVGEEDRLGIVVCHEKTDFTEIRQILDALLVYLGVEGKVKETKDPRFIAGRVGEILIGSKKIGVIGEIHPAVLEKWGITVPAVGMEVDVGKMLELAQ
ncbi:phenylalanine--tRNA ligase subunit beta [Candidatus Woesearchaeota archaeon]|nr:phenylalanine--tRNA ligase subunit beta [Candidatus Woesearchaeota archaeon]